MFLYKIHSKKKKKKKKKKKSFINCSNSYSSFILSKNILSVKHSAHFDFSFAFLFHIKTRIFGCVDSVCFLQFSQ